MRNHFTRLFLAVIICLFCVTVCKAQYSTGVGVKVGKLASGVDYKHFFDTDGKTGYEIFVGYTQEGFGGYVGKVFFIKQLPIQKTWVPFPLRLIFRQSRLQVPLKLVFGVGAHTGYSRNLYFAPGDVGILHGYNTFNAGIDATVGFEYNTRKWPITIGIDCSPFYSFINPGDEFVDFGLNIRYVFRESANK